MNKYLLILSMIVVGCKIFDDQDEDHVDSTNLIFPLEVGSYWKYMRSFKIINVDSSKFDTTSIIEMYTLSVDRVDTIQDNSEVFVIKEANDSNQNQYSEFWLQNNENGLFEYAYKNPAYEAFSLKRSNKEYYRFHDESFSSIKAIFEKYKSNHLNSPLLNKKTNLYADSFAVSDSVVYLDSPRHILKYPYLKNDMWTYLDISILSGQPLKRKYIGKETININKKSYECFVVKVLYDLENDGGLDADMQRNIYFSTEQKGMVKQTFRINNIEGLDSLGNSTGYFDSLEEVFLIEENIIS